MFALTATNLSAVRICLTISIAFALDTGMATESDLLRIKAKQSEMEYQLQKTAMEPNYAGWPCAILSD